MAIYSACKPISRDLHNIITCPTRVVFVAVYYNNIWQAQNFPFVRSAQNLFSHTLIALCQLSQLLYYENGTQYNQTLILNSNYEVDPTLLAEQGLPWYSSTWVVNLLATNMGLAATFTHLLLWNMDDLREAWGWASPSALRKSWRTFSWRFWQNDGMRDVSENKESDPHYLEMLKVSRSEPKRSRSDEKQKYPDAPNSWYLVTLVLSIIIALVVIYKTDSTLPW